MPASLAVSTAANNSAPAPDLRLDQDGAVQHSALLASEPLELAFFDDPA